MKGYSRVEIFSEREVELWRQATDLVDRWPVRWDYKPCSETVLRCHEVARVVGALLELEVQDGSFGLVQHSWLWASQGRTILDVYAVGSLPEVQLVDARPLLPHHGKYRVGEPRTDIDLNVVNEVIDFLRDSPSSGKMTRVATRLSSDSCKRRVAKKTRPATKSERTT